ncbi:hypothetical protein [Streptomyces sp. NPDC005953]|uniref:hypothetical protein n=1 Tax=Streptomyces sp. NPDC005953 TaxID=3156719 RepID=UPI0033ECE343
MSSDRENTERGGPDGPLDDRTGNGIVNNGPDIEPSGHEDRERRDIARTDDADGAADAGAGEGGEAQGGQDRASSVDHGEGDTTDEPSDPGDAGGQAGPLGKPAADPVGKSGAVDDADATAGGTAQPTASGDGRIDGEPAGEEPASSNAGGSGGLAALAALVGPGASSDPGAHAGADGGAVADGGSGTGTARFGDGGPGDDEEAIRHLLQGVVQDLNPSAGALDHLRRAVPARRARKRQALVGAAAAVVLMGTAVPAFVHVAGSEGGDNARPINAGHGQTAHGGTESVTGEPEGDKATTGGPTVGSSGTPQGTGSPSPSRGSTPGKDASSDGATGSPERSPEEVPDGVPVCAADQLQFTSAQATGPDAEGKVYGSFKVANTSTVSCAVEGPGQIGFQAMGAADQGKIKVVDHTAGDAATGLPDPSQESSSLLLKPEGGYEVKFAWVPSESCPTGPTTPTDPPTSQEPSPGTGGGQGSVPDNTETQLLTTENVPQDGSISVSHTAEPGGPSTDTTIANACSGTLYRTGMLG